MPHRHLPSNEWDSNLHLCDAKKTGLQRGKGQKFRFATPNTLIAKSLSWLRYSDSHSNSPLPYSLVSSGANLPLESI